MEIFRKKGLLREGFDIKLVCTCAITKNVGIGGFLRSSSRFNDMHVKLTVPDRKLFTSNPSDLEYDDFPGGFFR